MALIRPLDEILKLIGHDGSEILWPNLPEPLRRRGFHVEELQYVARRLGFFLVPYIAGVYYRPHHPLAINGDFKVIDLTLQYSEVMLQQDGILVGHYYNSPNNHAVAWDCTTGSLYDPEGYIVSSPESFRAEAFYAVVPGGS